uniref:ATP synthase F0 subunit 8 n=1 Tax=Amusiotheres obtusidentatus TaxID=2921221 RepID=UPI002027A8DB|nr:ATP synthase F0 subunit 8 [Amusiotheres obtusidentatus]UPL64963.1 ATP synthase F0 subunit 8 [Amusiotheres obtusidentatus]
MPQMAPIYWLYLFCFFLSILSLFLIMNYFMPPFSKINSLNVSNLNNFKSWKL